MISLLLFLLFYAYGSTSKVFLVVLCENFGLNYLLRAINKGGIPTIKFGTLEKMG